MRKNISFGIAAIMLALAAILLVKSGGIASGMPPVRSVMSQCPLRPAVALSDPGDVEVTRR